MRLVFNVAWESQFPDRIVVSHGKAKSVWGEPYSRRLYGQGAGRDYRLLSGTSPFTVAGRELTVELQWD